MIEEIKINPISKEQIPVLGNLDNFELLDESKENLRKNKFECLYPIQISTYEYIYKGLNTLAWDHTGSGKTLAFLLPILEQYRQRKLIKSKEFPGPKVIVISPTWELANQIKDVLESLKHNSSEFNHAVLYGGQKNFIEQKIQLEKNPDVVVGTPGRIKAMLENGKFNAQFIETIVLDEADVLLEIGFDKDILEIHSKIMEQKNKETLQVICFSATFNSTLNGMLQKFSKEKFYKIDLIGNSDK